MLQRNLIYTGITRAKKIFVMVGTIIALSYAVRNVKVNDRNTMLSDCLRRLLPESGSQRQPDGKITQLYPVQTDRPCQSNQRRKTDAYVWRTKWPSSISCTARNRYMLPGDVFISGTAYWQAEN